MGLMVVLCLIWALQQISLKAVASEASPMLMVGVRSLIAAMLVAVLMWRRRERLSPVRRGPGAIVGTLFGLEYLLAAEALRLTNASHVIVFLYTAPIFAALGLHLRLKAERLNVVQWLGIALAFGGVAWAFLSGLQAADRSGAQQALWGDALALAAGMAWGATTVTIRCSSLSSAPATEMLLYQLLGAVVLLLPASAFLGQWSITPSWTLLAHLSFQSIVVSLASFLAWCWLLRRYLASQLGVFAFLTPLFGVVLGAWLLHESLERHFVVGSLLVIAGIAMVSCHAVIRRGWKVLLLSLGWAPAW